MLGEKRKADLDLAGPLQLLLKKGQWIKTISFLGWEDHVELIYIFGKSIDFFKISKKAKQKSLAEMTLNDL